MKCPACGSRARVVHTEPRRDGTHRWLRCMECTTSFRTLETYYDAAQTPPAAVLTHENVRKIRTEVNNGTPQGVIATEYGVTRETINRIANNKLWSHVE